MAIRYNVPVPRLDGMTEAQRNRALEEYMRESNRQMALVIASLTDDIKKATASTTTGETSGGTE